MSTDPRPDAARILPGLAESISVSSRMIDRYAYAHDASHYQLVPDAVATPASAAQVAALFREAKGRTLTFRALELLAALTR